MNTRTMAVILGCLATTTVFDAHGQDWPQWRGLNRDARVAGFKAPQTWPEALTKKWNVVVGEGVATPALVGNRIFVFGRQEGDEVVRCLDAESGEQVWQDKFETADADGAAARFPVLGPRSSPAVADGRVVTVGTRGALACHAAATGKLLWQKDDFRSWPRFFASSSPIIVDGLCIAQLGGDRQGGIVAYDLATGDEKWKWAGDGPAYGSPVLASIGGVRVIIAPTAENLVAVSVTDGKLLWEVPYTQGRYNAASPMVAGTTLLYAGPTRGMTAEKLVPDAEKLTAEPLWNNPDNSVMYNTPVLRKGLLFGLSNLNSLFCINAETGKTAWNAAVDAHSNTGGQQAAGEGGERRTTEGQQQQQEQERERRGRRGGGRRGGGSGGYGSIVDAGEVLLALTPAAELIVFEPREASYTEVARYKVAESPTYSYPVVTGNRIYIKDKDSLTLWIVE